jgi:hypothetical protein
MGSVDAIEGIAGASSTSDVSESEEAPNTACIVLHGTTLAGVLSLSMSEEELFRAMLGVGRGLSGSGETAEGAVGDTVWGSGGEKNDLGIDFTGLRRDDGDKKTEG